MFKTKAEVKEVAKPKEATRKRGPLREKDINIPLEVNLQFSLKHIIVTCLEASSKEPRR